MTFLLNTSLGEVVSATLTSLRESARDVMVLVRRLSNTKPRMNFEDILGHIKDTMRVLDGTVSEAREAADKLKTQGVAALDQHRLLQFEDNVIRPVHEPDILKSLLILQLCLLGEAGLTSALMIGNGEMDVVPAVMYGVSISFMNIVTGVVTGFLPCRYMSYRLGANSPGPYDSLIRLVSRIGFACFVAAMAGMHFGAMRVRATGSHSDLFDFSEVGFLAAFNDYYSLAILVVGAIGSIVAVYEGYHGFSDPKPGYSNSKKHVEEQYEESVHTIRDRFLDSAATQFEYTENAVSELIEYAAQAIDEYTSLHQEACEAAAAHNSDVFSARQKVQAVAARHSQSISFIKQRKAHPVQLDLSEFNALLIPELPELEATDIPDRRNLEKMQTALALLGAHYMRCVNLIELAFTQALTGASELQFYAHEGDRNDEHAR